MVLQRKPKRKGALADAKRIDQLRRRVHAERRSLDDAPHPHVEGEWPRSLSDVCPPGCPIQRRRLVLLRRLMRLNRLYENALVEVARSQLKGGRPEKITMSRYREIQPGTRSKKELASFLGVSRETLRKWEKANLR